MRRFKKVFSSVLAVLLVVSIPLNLLAAPVSGGSFVYYSGDGSIDNVILMIGDGMGNNHSQYAQWFYNSAYIDDTRKPLSMQQLPYMGVTSTFSQDNSVTDYGAAGTALATGIKTNNGKLSVDASNAPLTTLFSAVQGRGMATGVVTTGNIAKSTSTAFMASASSVSDVSAIVPQILDSDVDVIYGGGSGNIDAQVATQSGYSVVTNKSGMSSASGKVMGLFGADILSAPYNGSTTEPSIKEMTESAINLLKGNANGFFLVVESAKIAQYAAANNGDGVIEQVKLFDNAVKSAIDFANTNGNTLVIVTGSYETGGFTMPSSISRSAGSKASYMFTTTSNTSANVMLYAGGKGASAFTGVYDNTDIPKKIGTLLGITDVFPERLVSYGDLSNSMGNTHKDKEVKNIIFLIGDGMGQNHTQYAQWFYNGSQNKMNVQKMPVTGLVSTYSANNGVTDSAAAGTALATGYKTNNDVVGMDPSGKRLKNLLEASREQGKATGVVATSTVTDATPAAFTAHVPGRASQVEIAEQMAACGVDVILGGGQDYFSDYTLTKMRADGFSVAKTKAEMSSVDNNSRIVGLFKGGNLDTPYPNDTSGIEPTVKEMTDKAINMLKDRSANGFSLMVEGSKIDKESHGNNAVRALEEMKQFDDAVKAALDFAAADGNTLVLVTADHETGGFSVAGQHPLTANIRPTYTYTSGSHTASNVMLYAYGPGSEQFSGMYTNTDIEKKTSALMGTTDSFPSILSEPPETSIPEATVKMEFASENGTQVAESANMTASADVTGTASGTAIKTVHGSNSYMKFSTKGENAGRDSYAVRIGTGGGLSIENVNLTNNFSANIRVLYDNDGIGTLATFGEGIRLWHDASGILMCTYGGTSVPTNITMNKGAWYNIGVAFDYDKKLVRIIANGASKWANVYNSSSVPGGITVARNATESADLDVFTGAVDIFALYNALLEDDGLKELTVKGKKDVGDFVLKSSFNFIEETGNPNPSTATTGKVIDATGNYTNDTLVNGTLTYVNDAQANGGRALYMKNGSLAINNSTLSPNQSFTVTTRFKLEAADNHWHMLVRVPDGDRMRFMLNPDNYMIINMGGPEVFEESTGFKVKTGQYHTAVYVFDGIMGDKADDVFTIYIDGVQVYSKTYISGLPSGNWVFGAEGECFNGYFDYIDIYDGAVTADQAKLLSKASASEIGFEVQKIGKTINTTVENRLGAIKTTTPMVIFAAYDTDDNLIETKISMAAVDDKNPAAETGYTFQKDEGKIYKVFLWNSISNIIPLQKGYTFNSAMPSPIQSYDFTKQTITGVNVTQSNYTSDGLRLNIDSNGIGRAYNASPQEYIEIPNPIMSAPEYTISFRIKVPNGYIPGSTTNNWYARSYILDGEAPGIQNDFGLGMVRDGSKNKIIYGDDDVSTDGKVPVFSDGTEFIDGQFHTIAITRANGTCQIYIDGVLCGTGACGVNANNTPTILYIGRSRDGDGRIGAFTISNMDFYDVALNIDQVQNIY